MLRIYDVRGYRWFAGSRADHLTKQVIYSLHVQVQYVTSPKYFFLYPAIEFPTAAGRDDYMQRNRPDFYAHFAKLYTQRGIPHLPHLGRKATIQ